MLVQQPTRSLVDIVIYLASLVSDPRVIDPHLDTVRLVTANLPPSGEPTPQQTQALLDVKRKIEEHLLTQDQVRVFTPESLQLQLENYISGGTTKRATRQLLGSIFAAVAGTGLVTWLLIYSGKGLQVQVIGTAFFAMLHISAAYLFVSVLRAFTTKLRIAFRWICVGMVLLGLSLVWQPIIELVGLRGTSAGSLMGFTPPLIAAIIMFWGIRLYAQLSGVSTKKVSILLLFAILVLSLVSIVLPHAPSKLPGNLYSLVISIQVSTVAISATSGILLYKTSRRMSDLYSSPTRSLQFAVGVAMLVSLYTYMFRIVSGGLTAGAATFVIIGFVSLMGFAFLYSGYVFNKASRY